jgi:hypothetical protein
MTAGYIIMTTEDLRKPAQAVCDKLMELCGIPAGETGIRAVNLSYPLGVLDPQYPEDEFDVCSLGQTLSQGKSLIFQQHSLVV